MIDQKLKQRRDAYKRSVSGAAANKRWRARNKHLLWNNHLKHKFGITSEDYNAMFNLQSGCCKICKRHQNELNKKLHVDHCHSSGKVRGLLCKTCNVAIGLLRDDSRVLLEAAAYLREHE